MKYLDKAVFAAGGALFVTAGVAALTSKCAKKIYTDCTALVLRGRDKVMETQATLKENCQDIYEDAQIINKEKAAETAAEKLEEAKAMVEAAAAEEKAEK